MTRKKQLPPKDDWLSSLVLKNILLILNVIDNKPCWSGSDIKSHLNSSNSCQWIFYNLNAYKKYLFNSLLLVSWTSKPTDAWDIDCLGLNKHFLKSGLPNVILFSISLSIGKCIILK